MRFKFAKRSDIKRYGPVNDADVGKIIKRKKPRITTRAVLIPVTDLNPDSDFHDFFASIPIPIQFRVRSDSNLEPTPQVDLIPYTYIRTHCR